MAIPTKSKFVFAAFLLFGIAAVYSAIAFSAGGHGTYLPAKLLFPYTMLLALPEGSIALPGMALAVLQYPGYWFVATRAKAAGRGSRALIAICAVHTVAAAAAIALVPKDVFP